MANVFFSTCMLYSLKLVEEKNCEALFFALLNFINKLLHDGDYYCYCDEYAGCAWKFGQTYFCTICRIKIDFTETEVEFARFNWDLLKKISIRLAPYMTEILEVKPLHDEEFYNMISPGKIGEFFLSHRDNVTGIKTETSLTEMNQMYSDPETYNKMLLFKYDCLTYEEYQEKYSYKKIDE